MTLVQFSLYEIFGYIFPGAIGVAGMFLIYWRLFLPPNLVLVGLTSGWWWLLLGIIYFFGHILQAIANLALSWKSWHPEAHFFKENLFPESLRGLLEKKACAAIGLSGENQLTPELIYEISDHYVLQNGKTEVREIYVYREGFYRGMAAGLFFLSGGLLFHASGTSSLNVGGFYIALNLSGIAFLSSTSVVMAILSIHRYFRFANYRVKYALYSMLTKGV